jgi:hypothetical protein
MTYPKNQNASWYVRLLERFNTLVERHSIPDEIAKELREFTLQIAKEQYMSGNKCGIAYAHRTIREGVPSPV